jgi:carboxymethylenebutenolidase
LLEVQGFHSLYSLIVSHGIVSFEITSHARGRGYFPKQSQRKVIDTMTGSSTTNGQQLLEVWQQHTYAEFVMRDATAALTTMTENPYVLMVPIGVGGQGREGVHDFYSTKFLAQMPSDLIPISISQIIAENYIIEEAVHSFTHDQVMDWILPGVAPTRKRIEVVVIGIIHFENGKIAHEHLYWDQASVLAQIGLIDPSTPTVLGAEGPRKLLAWSSKLQNT